MNIFSRLFGRVNDYVKSGFIPWRFLHVSPQFNDYTSEADKLAVIFSNPALLKVFTLQCDLFSLAKVYVYNKAGELVKSHPAYDRLENPNPMQSQSQFLWDYMFWKMVGNAYLYLTSDLVDRDNAPMYWLEPHKIEWPNSIDQKKDHLIFSQSKLNEVLNTEVIYRYEDGSIIKIPIKKLCTITDLSNGVGNFFKGYSRIDALYKVISNSECALDSKNINVRYTGKFLVAGQQDPKDVTKLPMGKTEKETIEKRINGDEDGDFEFGGKKEKQVHAVKSMVDIKRFVEDIRVMPLDEAYLSDYYIIGSMFNIPRDVLEAYKSSTFENQEKARAGHVAYTLEPAGEELGNRLAKRWEFKPGWKVCLSWDHLPFTQVYEKERVSIKQTTITTMAAMLRAGIPIDEINAYLDTDFSEMTIYEPNKPASNGQQKEIWAKQKAIRRNGEAVAEDDN